MKTYANNMADQDLTVHSLRVLQDVKSPVLTQLKREVNSIQNSTVQISQKNNKYWQELSSDGIITPLEKKMLKREVESIANSYTALYTEAVAEHYESADFFQDYMATYQAFRDYIYYSLHLFDNMEENTEVDRDEFNDYFSTYYYSENVTIVSMTVGVISDLGFKVLTSLEDEGEEGDVGLYHGELYQYVDGGWKPLDRDLYYGKSAILPPTTEGRYFLCTDNLLLDDILYVKDDEDYDPLELNGEALTLFKRYEKGFIYVWEDYHWEKKDPATDYRYLVALGDYYAVTDDLPGVIKEEVAEIAREAAGSNYYGPLIVPPQNPSINDFFLYAGETSGTWEFAKLYLFTTTGWIKLDESDYSKRDYFMQALQDILTVADEETSTGYFSTVFCNAFFANTAAMNALAVHVIYLDTNGAIRSRETEYVYHSTGLLIDASGNIDANGNTHIGGECTIDGTTTIGGNTTIQGVCNVDKLHFSKSYSASATGFVNGDVWMVTI